MLAIRLGFAADLHAGNLVPADSDGGPVSPGLHTRLATAPCVPAMGGVRSFSLSVDRADDRGPSLLIEKDFQCLHCDETRPYDDADAFPNPSAGDQSGENFG
jgi:hypothetical protein